jgi:hypothetical protein
MNGLPHGVLDKRVVFPAVKTWAAVTKNGGHYAPIGGYLETHKQLLKRAVLAVSAFDALGTSATREEISSVTEAFVKPSASPDIEELFIQRLPV